MAQAQPIYLSYAISDTAFALHLAAGLKSRGVSVWLDRLDGGEHSLHAVQSRITGCAGVLAVLSPAYLDSRYCQQEIRIAEHLERPIVPVLLRPIPAIAGTSDLVVVDFSAWARPGSFEARLDDLIDELQTTVAGAVHIVPPPRERYLIRLIAGLEAHRAVIERATVPARQRRQAEQLAVRPEPFGVERWLSEGLFEIYDNSRAAGPGFRRQVTRLADVVEVTRQYPRLVLVGPPAVGKTALLNYLALQAARACQAAPDTAPLPILRRCIDWAPGQSLAEFIRAGWPLEDDPLTLLRHGQAALYLDGLGETDAATAITQADALRAWLEAEAPRTLVITCEEQTYARGLGLGLPVARPVPWDRAQVQAYVADHLEAEKARRVLLRLLPEEERPARNGLLSLLRHPLLLSIFAHLCEILPEDITAYSLGFLLEQYVVELWEQHSATATVTFQEVEAGLSALAYAAVAGGMPVYLPEDYVREHVRDPRLLAPENCAAFLEVSHGSVRFIHGLIRYYFAALQLMKLDPASWLQPPQFDPSENRIPQALDPVAVIATGLFPDAATFLDRIAAVDPYLALECASSGIQIAEETRARLVEILLSAPAVTAGGGRVAALRLLPPRMLQERLPLLLSVMRDGSWDARWAAVDTLLELGVPLALEIVEMLQDFQPGLREAAASGLRKIGESVLPSLITLLRADEPEIRANAAWALGSLADRAAVPALVETLYDPEEQVAGRAATALGLIKDPAAIPWLARLLTHTSADVRRAAADALLWLGGEAIPAMLDAVRDGDGETRELVIATLRAAPDGAVRTALLEATGHPDVEVRSAAVEALGEAEDDVTITHLIRRLRDKGQSQWRSETISDTARQMLLRSSQPRALQAVADWEHDEAYSRQIVDPNETLPDEELHDLRGNHLPARANGRNGSSNSAARAKDRLLHMTGNGSESLPGLTSPDWEERRDAVASLSRRDVRVAIPLLRKALDDEDPYVRIAAVRALGAFKTSEALQLLLVALADEEVLVCDAVAEVLRQIGRPAIPGLIGALEAESVEMRAAALEVLGAIADPETIPHLARMLEDTARPWLSDKRVCDLAAQALRSIGTTAAHQIVLEWQARHAPDPEQFARLTQAQLDSLASGKATVEELLETLPEREGQPVPLADSTPQAGDSDILAGLLAELQQEGWTNRQEAAKALREYAKIHQGSTDPAMIRQLTRALQDPDWVVRWAVAEALASIGTTAAVPALVALVDDEHWLVRVAAIRAVMMLGDAEVAPQLTRALSDPKEMVREAAAEALGTIGDERVAPALVPLLDDPEEFVRMAAIYALGRLRYVPALEALGRAIADPSVNIRWAAAVAVADVADPAAVPILAPALADTSGPSWGDGRVCDVAAQALEALDTPEARAALEAWRSRHSVV